MRRIKTDCQQDYRDKKTKFMIFFQHFLVSQKCLCEYELHNSLSISVNSINPWHQQENLNNGWVFQILQVCHSLNKKEILMVPVIFAELGHDGPSKCILVNAPTTTMPTIPKNRKKAPCISSLACLYRSWTLAWLKDKTQNYCIIKEFYMP